jgi:hypothetical protein
VAEGPGGPESGSHGELRVELSRCSGLLRAAYSSLKLQSRVLGSQSGNGIWRGQDSGVNNVAKAGTIQRHRHPGIPSSSLASTP